MFSRPTALEQFQAYIFTSHRVDSQYKRAYLQPSSEHELLAVSQRILGREEASALFRAAAKKQGITSGLPKLTSDFTEELERQFSSVVGAATAHALFAQMTTDGYISVSELVALADESAQVRAILRN